MSLELLRLHANPHRDGSQELIAVVTKVAQKARKSEVDLTLLRQKVVILDYITKSADSHKVQKLPVDAVFDVVLDHNNKTIEFGFNDRKAALPEALRGSGLGRYLLSEMIGWVQKKAGDYSVLPIKVSGPESAGSGLEDRLKAYFSRHGFTIVAKPGKGVYASAGSPAGLVCYVNEQKITTVNLIAWANELQASKANLMNELDEQTATASFYKDKALQMKDSKGGHQPLMTGLLIGFVVGLIAGVLTSL